MDAETLKVVAQVAGIGGVALAVLLMVFREVIQKNIFPNLSQDSGYRLLRLIIVSTWSVAIVGVGAWVYAREQAKPTVDASGTVVKEFSVSGLITDGDNNGLSDVDVFMVGAEDHVRTNDSGAFTLKLRAAENSIVNVRVSKSGYRARTENVKLPSSGLIVALTASGGAGQSSAPQNPALAPVVDVPRVDGPSGRDAEDAGRRPGATNVGRVYLRYQGDLFSCILNVSFRLGDRTVVPVGGPGQPFAVDNIALGSTPYSVGGVITCPSFGGACTATGSGRLNLENEGTYNVVWEPNYPTCQVGLIKLP